LLTGFDTICIICGKIATNNLGFFLVTALVSAYLDFIEVATKGQL